MSTASLSALITSSITAATRTLDPSRGDLPGEQWRIPVNCPHGRDYQVSQYGRVRHRRTMVPVTIGRWGQSSLNVQLTLSVERRPSNWRRMPARSWHGVYRLHRLVAETWLPEFSPDCVVTFRDRNSLNCEATNLRVTSPAILRKELLDREAWQRRMGPPASLRSRLRQL